MMLLLMVMMLLWLSLRLQLLLNSRSIKTVAVDLQIIQTKKKAYTVR